jgi:hypothetical protein
MKVFIIEISLLALQGSKVSRGTRLKLPCAIANLVRIIKEKCMLSRTIFRKTNADNTLENQ